MSKLGKITLDRFSPCAYLVSEQGVPHNPRNQPTVSARIASILEPPGRPSAQPLQGCLTDLQRGWVDQRPLARLSSIWPQLVGPSLASHSRPLTLQGRMLTVAVDGVEWIAALNYSRHQLLGRLRATGFVITTLRLQRRARQPMVSLDQEQVRQSWREHPSRVQQGMEPCGICAAPAPSGELRRWGRCAFCHRQSLSPPPIA